MLYSLKIENIAIIEQAEIYFSPGLNVLTGETGAGKSIIIDSINAVLGERTSRELIRSGAQSARVTAVFENVSQQVKDAVEEIGASCEDSTLILTRVISDSKNTCRINGAPATVSMLKKIGERLVNIHGQHDSQALLAPDKHCGFIDSLAENGALRDEYRSCFSQLVKVKKELEALYTDEDEKAARLEMLDFQIDEIEKAALRIGERDELTVKKNLCLNSQKVLKAYNAAYAALSGTDDGAGAVDALQSCALLLENAAKISPEAESAAKSAKELYYGLADLSAQVRSLGDSFDYNPEMLAEIDERLDIIFRLTHKYGADESAVLANLEAMKLEREKIVHCDEKAQELEAELAQLSENLKQLASKLTHSRKTAARMFEQRVCDELSFLDMPNVRFVVDIRPASYSSKGADALEFLISANAGETPKPLARIASGGELSRTMLAIKNVISAKDDIATLIFDEVDSGVSGRAAQKIALKLKEVSDGRQVICVTHLAQIAAGADSHLKISKSVEDDKTYTQVSVLDFEQRKHELARIMSGLEATSLQLETAEELLNAAGVKN